MSQFAQSVALSPLHRNNKITKNFPLNFTMQHLSHSFFKAMTNFLDKVVSKELAVAIIIAVKFLAF